jgi:hypothetical protein
MFGMVNLPFGATEYALRLFPGLQDFASSTAIGYAFLTFLLGITVVQAIRLVRNGNMTAAFAQMPEQDAMFLIIGAALIAGCFFTGQSIAYRGVHLIFVVAGLVAMRRATDNSATRAMLTRAIVIVIFLMWEELFRQALPHPGFVWLIREVLWWRLAALLVGILAFFGAKSELVGALQQRHQPTVDGLGLT